MSDKETDNTKQSEQTELAPGDITEFVSVFIQLNKGRIQVEATKALHEVVEAALTTGKKGGSMSIKLKVEPLESGAVSLIPDVQSNPAKDPAGTIFFADGEGNLSRDNASMFYS